MQKIQTQLNNDVHSLQEELRRKTAEVESCKEDAKRRLDLLENEKSKLQESIEGLERELQMKSAALQSLMLAKQVQFIEHLIQLAFLVLRIYS